MTRQADFFDEGHAPDDAPEPDAEPRGAGGFDQRDAPPTRDAGLARLADFVPRAGRAYASDRNHDFGPDRRANVSGLSPYVRRRLVTEEEIAAAALERRALSTAEKFVQEVCWRTYWKGWLERRPSVWRDYLSQLRRDADAMEKDGRLRADYEAAVSGASGIEGFDDWARELVGTGYLHNHARMWFASIWVFTLELPWTLGADYFLRHLLDGDPASNTLGWRWVAGLQTPGKAYLARASNIRKFTDGRFSPTGLNESAEPLDGSPPGGAAEAPVADPIDPDAKTWLLLHDEDCRAEELDLMGARISGVAALAAAPASSPYRSVAAPLAFARGALDDARSRAETFLGVAAAAPSEPGEIAEAAAAAGVSQVIAPWAPVGATQDRLLETARLLAERDVRLVKRVRGWDAAFWPHAHKGFFNLKKQIPAVLRERSLQ